MGYCSILLNLGIHFSAFYTTCTAWQSYSFLFHTTGRRFVQEEILKIGKGITEFSLQHQIEYSVKVLFTNKLKIYSLYLKNILLFRPDRENGKSIRNFYHRVGIWWTTNS
jgi:hypothetical protein